MRLLTYQMPDELLAIANAGQFDEFDLNEFFAATGTGKAAKFKHKDDVQKSLNIIRGSYMPKAVEHLKTGTKPPFPYSDSRLLPYLQHSFWFLPNVASCQAMANLLTAKHNVFWHDYTVVAAAGASAGIGLEALPPVRKAIGSGFDSKTITLSCGKLTTGVTVAQWSSILMLRNLKSPETYFQAAFRVQSPWSIKNPNGDNPNRRKCSSRHASCSTSRPRAPCASCPNTGSGCRRTSPPRGTRSRTWYRPCRCWPMTART
ncbi:hypothetical protein RLIN73S_00604 [Rhodanobacter lindaniclasticus]